MAPVGSRESLAAAFQAGADSVYFGIGTLNMPSKSANEVTIDDHKEIASLCAERGVKSYLTVNTVIYDEDLPLMRQIVDAAKEAADDITENIVKAMADKQPLRVLFRDSCFGRDDAKINVFETLKQLLDWSEEDAMNNIKVI